MEQLVFFLGERAIGEFRATMERIGRKELSVRVSSSFISPCFRFPKKKREGGEKLEPLGIGFKSIEEDEG